MKIKLILAFALITLLSPLATAQTKIGYIVLDPLFQQWPETIAASNEVKAYELELQNRLRSKVRTFQTQVAEYNKNQSTLSDAEKKAKEEELQKLQQDIQQFEANAQQAVAEKNQSLLIPLQDKMQKTIGVVAKERGFTHVFTYGNALVFTTDESADISDFVAQKLGYTLVR